MKKGMNGLTGCCTCWGIWGVHVNAPNPLPTEHSGPGADYGSLVDTSNDNLLTSRFFAYSGRAWENTYGVAVTKEVRPEIWTPTDETGDYSWHALAVKLPLSYPGDPCQKYPPISSGPGDEGGTGEWQSELGVIMAAETYNVESHPPLGNFDTPRGFGFVYRSRAIYTDGRQSHLAYCMTGRKPEADGATGLTDNFHLPNPPRPAGLHLFGDTIIIDIHEPDPPTIYKTDTLDGIIFDSTNGTHASRMEGAYSRISMGTTFPDNIDIQQWPNYQMSYGKRYSAFTSYTPDFIFGNESAGYQFVRIKYVGERRDDDNNVVTDVVEVFSTWGGGAGNTDPDLGKSGTTYDGDYIVIMPAQNCALDGTADTDDSPDEPYVAAIHKDFSSTHVIVGLFKSKVFRSGVGSEDDYDGIADGTLDSGEVAAAETIIDAAFPPAAYPDETFPNFALWCFNRVWDPVDRENKNLLLFTTHPDELPGTSTSGIVADFEQPDGFDPHYLDHGLDAYGLAFKSTGDVSGNEWIADNVHAHGGSYSAYANINATLDSNAILWTTIQVMTNGSTCSLWYILDNRGSGTRIPGFAFNELTNFPIIDNTLKLTVNGATIPIKIDGVDYPTSVIDNENVPDSNPHNDPDFYLTWKQITFDLGAGANTIKLTLHRAVQDNFGKFDCWTDDWSFPTVMIGDDLDGLTRWAYYLGKVHKLSGEWTWPERDEEGDVFGPTPIDSRASTVPYFITLDGHGQILIGNPHAVVRFNRDGTIDDTHGGTRGPGFDDGKGWARWTASPNSERPLPSCLDPSGESTVDVISDTPPGGYWIYPTGRDEYQVIGANGDVDRDATTFPFTKAQWSYKHPTTGVVSQEIFWNKAIVTIGGFWNMRAHRWKVSNDGKDLEPALEVIWRPTMHQPAYPGEAGTTDEERFPSPPYRSDFADSTAATEWAPASVRWRDPLQAVDVVLSEGTITAIPGGYTISDGAASNSHIYDRGTFIVGAEEASVSSYDPDTKTVQVGAGIDSAMVGDDYKIVIATPRWSQTNIIISRTCSDAWSAIAQSAWVRVTDDPPPEETDPGNYWSPDESEAEIAARQDPGEHFFPRGGPWGSAQWVLVMARYNPVGALWFFYEYNTTDADLCIGHGADEEEAVESPPTRLTTVQGIVTNGVINSTKAITLALTDFAAIQCDCSCGCC